MRIVVTTPSTADMIDSLVSFTGNITGEDGQKSGQLYDQDKEQVRTALKTFETEAKEDTTFLSFTLVGTCNAEGANVQVVIDPGWVNAGDHIFSYWPEYQNESTWADKRKTKAPDTCPGPLCLHGAGERT